MKNFLGLLFLILTLQIPSHADYINHIQKFKIEGISVGDSLLDHFSEEQIRDNRQTLTYKSERFITQEFLKSKFSLDSFDSIQTAYKNGDPKYINYSISGSIFFPNNINACYKKQREILKELDKKFGKLESARKIPLKTFKHGIDDSGKSKVTTAGFSLKDYEVVVQCMDFSNEINLKDELVVAIDANEFIKFLQTEAY